MSSKNYFSNGLNNVLTFLGETTGLTYTSKYNEIKKREYVYGDIETLNKDYSDLAQIIHHLPQRKQVLANDTLQEISKRIICYNKQGKCK